MPGFNKQARQKARRYVLQALYQWQFSNTDLTEIEIEFHNHHNMEKVDKEYFHELLHQIPAKLDEIDQLYQPFLSKNQSQLTPIELTALRIGSYELAHRLDVPYRVVVNEAVELTKVFGTVEGYRFVNGVLDKVARQLRSNEIKS